MNISFRIKRSLSGIFTLLSVCLLVGCASERTPATFDEFLAEDLNDTLETGQYTLRFENFILIMDTSATMNKRYLYEAFDTDVVPTLFEVEKEIAKRLNQTLPDTKINAGIRTFGFGICQSWGFSAEWLSIGPYSRQAFNEALESIECAGGGSPMEYAIEKASEDVELLNGRTGLIIISDGGMSKAPFNAVVDLRRKYDKQVCVYTISLGKDYQSKVAMRRLAAFSGCGFSARAEDLADSEGMAKFVKRVFLKKNDSSAKPR